MREYPVAHLADQVLFREFDTADSQVCGATAWLLAYLGEIDARKLYLTKAYPSMFAYCVGERRMSEDCACRRIHVAQLARQFRSLLPAIADGSLNLTSVLMLASNLKHMTPEAGDELLAAAANKSKVEIQKLLAKRFPQPDLPTLISAIPDATPVATQSVGVQGPVSAPARIECASAPAAPAKLAPRSPGRFSLQVTVSEATHEKLRYAQALLGHAVPSRDISAVLDRAFDALVEKLERRKFAKSVRSRPRKGSPKGRHVPAEIRRTVWQRDAGQCTFVSDAGKRCDAHDRLEFDHVVPVAKGGLTTASNLRLRCRAHNQFEAERAFGAGFMQAKRDATRRAAADAKTRRLAEAESRARAQAEAAARSAREEELMPFLQQLGYKGKEARLGAETGARLVDASIEQRVRAALNALAPRCVRPAASPDLGSVANSAFAVG